MKLTIINSDKAVYKDKVSYSNLTLSDIPADVHALQWDNDNGWIEYKNHVKPNESISSLPQWANDALTVWQQAYDTEEAVKIAAAQIAQQTAQQEGAA